MNVNKLANYKPKIHPLLTPYIKDIEIIDHAAQAIMPYKVYPNLTITMGFQYQGRLHVMSSENQLILLKLCGVTGLLKHYKTFQAMSITTKSILIRFYPWGIPTLLNLPAYVLTNQSLGLGDLLGDSMINNLEERIQAAENLNVAINSIQAFFIQLKLKHHAKFSSHPRVIAIAQQLARHPTGNSIAQLARQYGYSKRSLERYFLENIGLSPKRFMLTARFQHVLHQLQVHTNWEEIAEQWDYYDQAHFIKDVKQFTGSTPQQLIQIIS